MLVIHKVQLRDTSVVIEPAGKITKWLDVQLQQGVPTLWYEVDLSHPLVQDRTVTVVGTGHEFEGGEYIGTFQDGMFVFHAYGETL